MLIWCGRMLIFKFACVLNSAQRSCHGNINSDHLIWIWFKGKTCIHGNRITTRKKYNSIWVLGKINALQWRHYERDSVSNHQPHDCLLNRLFRRRSKKTSKPRVTGLCVGNSPGTGEFPAQMASYGENVSIWWRHHDLSWYTSSNFFVCVEKTVSRYRNHWGIYKCHTSEKRIFCACWPGHDSVSLTRYGLVTHIIR